MKPKIRRLICLVLALAIAGTIPSAATDTSDAGTGRAGLHMAYLGSEDTPAATEQELPDASKWVVGAKFWIGVYVDDLTELDTNPPEGLSSHIRFQDGDSYSVGGGISNVALGLNYASLYLEPVSTGDEILAALSGMPKWTKYLGYTVVTYNKTEQAISGLKGAETDGDAIASGDSPKMLYWNMRTTGQGLCYSSIDDDPVYLLVAQFEVKAIPAQGTKIFSMALDPVHLAMQTGVSGRRWYAQWNADVSITPDQNLKNHFTYAGDLNFEFPETNKIVLARGMYLESYTSSGVPSTSGSTPNQGSLPKGLTMGAGTITGTPEETGVFDFQIGTQWYSITIDKQPITVKVKDACLVKTYGDSLGELKLDYEGKFAAGESAETLLKDSETTAPVASCAANETTPAGEKVPVTWSVGESKNYEFRCQDAEITVTKRPLTVTKFVYIPSINSNSDCVYEVTDIYQRFIAKEGDVVNDDKITLKYTATFENTTVPEGATNAEKNVIISNPEILEIEGEQGSNYYLTEDFIPETKGLVDNRNIREITATALPRESMEYEYGETLELSALRVTMDYETAEDEENVTYDDLLSRHFEIMLEKDGQCFSVTDGMLLSAALHDGAELGVYLNDIKKGTIGTIKVNRRELQYKFSQPAKVYDGTTDAVGVITLLNVLDGDEVAASGVFTFADANVSLTPPQEVYVTNIALSGRDKDNYSIDETGTTSGEITRARQTIEMPALEAKIDPTTNHLVVSAPLNDPEHPEVVYQYSIDGTTWQTAPEFSGLVVDREYTVQVCIAASGNYSQSTPSEGLTLKTYANRIRLFLVSGSGEQQLVAVTYTDLEVAGSQRELFGTFETRTNYSKCYWDAERTRPVEYPLTISRDNTFYVRRSTSETKDYTARPKYIAALVGGDPVQASVIGLNSERKLQWRSSDETVARVDENGLVSFVGIGETWIVAASDGEDLIWIPVTVKLAEVAESSYILPYISGYPGGSFRPDDSISRAEMAVILDRVLLGNLEVAQRVEYADVPEDAWYCDAVQKLSGVGLLSGYPDGTFCPEGALTRAETAALIARAAGLTANDEVCAFSDCIGIWAEAYIRAVNQAGLMFGYPDGTFHPDAMITRAEAVTMVNKMIRAGAVASGQTLTIPTDMTESHWAYQDVLKAMNHREILSRASQIGKEQETESNP